MKTFYILIAALLLSSASLAQEQKNHGMVYHPLTHPNFTQRKNIPMVVEAGFDEPIDTPNKYSITEIGYIEGTSVYKHIAETVKPEEYNWLPKNSIRASISISHSGKMLSVVIMVSNSDYFNEADLPKYRKLYDKIMSVTIDEPLSNNQKEDLDKLYSHFFINISGLERGKKQIEERAY